VTTSNPMTATPAVSPGLSPSAGRWIATGLAVGTLMYIVPSAVHGNPPVESAELALHYVAERPSWRLVHLVNVGAVLVWAVALAALVSRLAGAGRDVGRAARLVLTVGAAVFAVYFSIHAMALPVAAQRFVTGAVDPEQVLVQTEAVLLVLGATAFAAQALLGLSVLLHGLTVVTADRFPAWVGWLGVLAGAGWLVGALLVDFAVIVPFTVLAWVWMLVLAGTVLRAAAGRRTSAPAS
jgi:hypothetical protein